MNLRQREPRLELPKLIAAVRTLEECTLNVPDICIGRDFMACHDNSYQAGKGKGLKSHDCFIAAGCLPCHKYIDDSRHEDRWEIMRKARDRTLYLLFKTGKLKVA